MATNMSDRTLSLAAWATKRLRNAGPAYPRTVAALGKVVSPQSNKYVSYSSIDNLLEVVGRLATDRQHTLTVPVLSLGEHTTDVPHFNQRLWNECKRRAQSKNLVLSHSCNSKATQEIQQRLETWVKEEKGSFSGLSENQLFQKLWTYYMKNVADVHQNVASVTDDIIGNLSQNGYVKIDDTTGAVTYDFPSEFTVNCVKEVVEKTKKWWDIAFSSKKQPDSDVRCVDHYNTIVVSTNGALGEMLLSLKEVEGDFVERAAFSDAVDSFRKKKTTTDAVIRLFHHHGIPGMNPFAAKKTEKQAPTSTKEVNNYTDGVTDNILGQLCKGIDRLSFKDIGYIPMALTFEGAVGLVMLHKMGKSKPKTMHKLKNILNKSCQFFSFVPLWNLEVFEVSSGRRASAKTKQKNNNKTAPKSYVIKLKKKTTRTLLSLEPSSLFQEIDAKELKKEKNKTKAQKRKAACKSETSNKRKRFSFPEIPKENAEKDTKKCTAIIKQVFSQAENAAKKLSTFVVPSDEQEKFASLGRIRATIAAFQQLAVPMDVDGSDGHAGQGLRTRQQLEQELIKACFSVETFPVDETVKALATAGVISYSGDLQVTVSKSIDATLDVLEEKLAASNRKEGRDDSKHNLWIWLVVSSIFVTLVSVIVQYSFKTDYFGSGYR